MTVLKIDDLQRAPIPTQIAVYGHSHSEATLRRHQALNTLPNIALVVEDNPEFRDVIAQALSKLDGGWCTRLATNGADGDLPGFFGPLVT